MSVKTTRAQTAVMQAPTADVVVAQAQGVVKFMQIAYSFWMTIYVILGTLSVGLPGLAAMALFNSKANQALAGGGALAAAVFAFLKPHQYATAFDNASQIVWRAINDFQLGIVDNIAVAKSLAHAVRLTSFRYGAIGSSPSGEQNPTESI